MNRDKQVEYIIKEYIIPLKEFDLMEINQEELIAIKEGTDKFSMLSEEEKEELIKKYKSEM